MDNELMSQTSLETTGRFIVTFREGAHTEAMATLEKHAGVTKAKMLSSVDFGESGVDMAQFPDSGGVMFDHIGVAVVSIDPTAAGAMAEEAGGIIRPSWPSSRRASCMRSPSCSR
jgi:hypothetical protein